MTGVTAALLAGSIAAAVPAAVERTMSTMPQLLAEPDTISELQRRLYTVEVENEVTRAMADAFALRIASGGCDIASTGWAIENGSVERNALLGGSRNNALIIIGTKVVMLGVEYVSARRQASAYKACMLKRYDGNGASCGQLATMKRVAALASASRLGLCGWNASLAAKDAGAQP